MGDIADIAIDVSLVSKCGLYCAQCGAYKKGRCAGCLDNIKAKWCKVRSCCLETQRASCADCTEFADPADCSKFNNTIGKIIGFVLNSDRRAGVLMIKDKGRQGFAEFMSDYGRPALKRKHNK